MRMTTKTYRSASLSSYKSYKELVAEREASQRKRAEQEEELQKTKATEAIIKSGYLEYYPTSKGPKNIQWTKHWLETTYIKLIILTLHFNLIESRFFLTKENLFYGEDEVISFLFFRFSCFLNRKKKEL